MRQRIGNIIHSIGVLSNGRQILSLTRNFGLESPLAQLDLVAVAMIARLSLYWLLTDLAKFGFKWQFHIAALAFILNHLFLGSSLPEALTLLLVGS